MSEAKGLIVLDEEGRPAAPTVFSTCRDCVFAAYNGADQAGCRLGRLEAFARAGARVERGWDVAPDWDEGGAAAEWEARARIAEAAGEVAPPKPEPPRDPAGRSFFRLAGRVCTTNRHKDGEWAARVPPGDWASRAREEVRVRLAAVVVAMPGDTLGQVVATARSLEAQTLPFRQTHFVVNTPDVRPAALVAALRGLGPALVWNVRGVTARDRAGGRLDAGACIDLAADGLDPAACNYYAAFSPGFAVPPGFAAEVEAALNDRMERFLVLTPTPGGQGLVVQTKIHKYVLGHREATHEEADGRVVRCRSVADKVRLLARDDGAAHLVRPAAEVCPCLG